MNALERFLTDMLARLIPPHEHTWTLRETWYWKCRCGAESLLVADRGVHAEES